MRPVFIFLWIIYSAGSNPNANVTTTKWATEYRVEYFQPPYMSMTRPSFSGQLGNIAYGEQFTLDIVNDGHALDIEGMYRFILYVALLNTFVPYTPLAVIIDLGYHTHAVSLDSKYVALMSMYDPIAGTLTVTGREY